MALPEEFFDAEVERLAALYSTALRNIRQKIENATARGRLTDFKAVRAEELERQIQEAMDSLARATEAWARRAIPAGYRTGMQAVSDAFELDLPTFSGINREKAAAIANQMVAEANDVALKSVAPYVGDTFTRAKQTVVAHSRLLQDVGVSEIEGLTVKDLTKRIIATLRTGAVERLRDIKGMDARLVDDLKAVAEGRYVRILGKDGILRKYNLEKYGRLLARTMGRFAASEGVVQTTLQYGGDLVQVSVHSQACPQCVPIQGRVYSITGKTEGFPVLTADVRPPIHPNCEHVLLPVNADFLRSRGLYDGLRDWSKSGDPVGNLKDYQELLQRVKGPTVPFPRVTPPGGRAGRAPKEPAAPKPAKRPTVPRRLTVKVPKVGEVTYYEAGKWSARIFGTAGQVFDFGSANGQLLVGRPPGSKAGGVNHLSFTELLKSIPYDPRARGPLAEWRSDLSSAERVSAAGYYTPNVEGRPGLLTVDYTAGDTGRGAVYDFLKYLEGAGASPDMTVRVVGRMGRDLWIEGTLRSLLEQPWEFARGPAPPKGEFPVDTTTPGGRLTDASRRMIARWKERLVAQGVPGIQKMKPVIDDVEFSGTGIPGAAGAYDLRGGRGQRARIAFEAGRGADIKDLLSDGWVRQEATVEGIRNRGIKDFLKDNYGVTIESATPEQLRTALVSNDRTLQGDVVQNALVYVHETTHAATAAGSDWAYYRRENTHGMLQEAATETWARLRWRDGLTALGLDPAKVDFSAVDPEWRDYAVDALHRGAYQAEVQALHRLLTQGLLYQSEQDFTVALAELKFGVALQDLARWLIEKAIERNGITAASADQFRKEAMNIVVDFQMARGDAALQKWLADLTDRLLTLIQAYAAESRLQKAVPDLGFERRLRLAAEPTDRAAKAAVIAWHTAPAKAAPRLRRMLAMTEEAADQAAIEGYLEVVAIRDWTGRLPRPKGV